MPSKHTTRNEREIQRLEQKIKGLVDRLQFCDGDLQNNRETRILLSPYQVKFYQEKMEAIREEIKRKYKIIGCYKRSLKQ